MKAVVNVSIPTVSVMKGESHYGDVYNYTGTLSSSNDILEEISHPFAINIVIVCVCIIGLGGNGIVICLLGFLVKRSPFTTYILNLAVADFGVLLSISVAVINKYTFLVDTMIGEYGIITYTASQLLLTAISIDRCVSVLFPIWHRCHRPPHLSTTVCALMWVLACLPLGSIVIFDLSDELLLFLFSVQFLVGAILCLPLVTVSTMILLFKVSCKLKQPRRGKVLTIVLLTLLFFLIFAFPLNIIATLNYFKFFHYGYLALYGYLGTCLNSCVNPVIYYLVGRKKKSQQRQSLKVILQRAFKEEDEQREEGGAAAQTQL